MPSGQLAVRLALLIPRPSSSRVIVMPSPRRSFRRNVRAAERRGVPRWLAVEVVKEAALRALVDARYAGIRDTAWLTTIIGLANRELSKVDAPLSGTEVSRERDQH